MVGKRSSETVPELDQKILSRNLHKKASSRISAITVTKLESSENKPGAADFDIESS